MSIERECQAIRLVVERLGHARIKPRTASVKEAAIILKQTQQHVRALLACGLLRWVKVGVRKKRIPLHLLERLQRR